MNGTLNKTAVFAGVLKANNLSSIRVSEMWSISSVPAENKSNVYGVIGVISLSHTLFDFIFG